MKERILVIEDDEAFQKTLVNLLEKKGYSAIGVGDGKEAIKTAKRIVFDLIVADVRLPGIDGLETIEKIREDENNKNARTLIVTGYADTETPIRAIRLGVDDYIHKPFKMEVFLHSVNRLIKDYRMEKRVKYYRRLSILDGLTEVFNHRYFHEIIVREMKRAERYAHPLSVLMIDIDDFKKYNDTYGHLAGDRALKKATHVFNTYLRNVDMIFRYGGEEFTILLPETDKVEAVNVAERIRQKVEETRFELDEPQTAKITVSIGVVCFPEDATEKEPLLQKVDKALYQAKKSGKNRVYTASDIVE
ncbi:MAG: diguanylate cyclase [Candidatus Omnitrophica bacterium]|nr:diguanylate cyclase [Candidatus Omnitrophota bacterium]